MKGSTMLTSSKLDPLHLVTVDFQGQSRQTDTLEKKCGHK